MRKAKIIKNISNEIIRVNHGKGSESILPPSAKLTNVNITNERELEGKAAITFDLTEVNESSGKIKLND